MPRQKAQKSCLPQALLRPSLFANPIYASGNPVHLLPQRDPHANQFALMHHDALEAKVRRIKCVAVFTSMN